MQINSVYFELTNLCNLNCATCFNSSGLTKKREEMPLSRLIPAIEAFREHGCKIFLFSGGEPLLYTELCELLQWIQRNEDCQFIFSTNGTVRNTHFSDSYQRCPHLSVQISLDGSSEEINVRTRGTGNFRSAEEFLSNLHACGAPYRYRIKMVVSKHNKDDIEDYFALAAKYNCVPEFAFVSSLGNGKSNWDSLSLSVDEKMSVLSRIKACNEKWNCQAQMPFCETGCPLMSEKSDRLSLLVKTNGDIHPCQGLYDRAFCLGNLGSSTIPETLDALKQLSVQLSERQTADFGCGKCLIRSFCSRGCPAAAYTNSGSILGSDGQCEFRLRQSLKYLLRR